MESYPSSVPVRADPDGGQKLLLLHAHPRMSVVWGMGSGQGPPT